MWLPPRTLAYLAIAYSFIFLSLALRTPWLLLFAIPVAIVLFTSKRLPRPEPVPVIVTRHLRPERSVGGEDVYVTLTVTNATPHKTHSFLLEDHVPEELRIEGGTNRLLLSLAGNEATQFQYRISNPKRGSYPIGPTLISFSDNLSLHSTEAQFHNVTDLLVLPQIEKLGTLDLRGRRFGPWPGLVPSQRIGEGTEFFELTPYVSGVDLRRVNWKASARAGVLVTNEFEGEQVIDVLVILDCAEATGTNLFDYDALEFQTNFVASLCSQLIMQGNRVGLAIYGAVRTWVSPGFGRRHLIRLLDSLAVVKPGPATLPINYVVESVIKTTLPARSLVLLVSPLVSDDVVNVIETVTVQGYSVACFTPEPSSETQPAEYSAQIARRIFLDERKLRLVRAKKIAYVAQISPRQPIRPLLRGKTRWNPA
jgi:uncharacterized protein (DUF58 family)